MKKLGVMVGLFIGYTFLSCSSDSKIDKGGEVNVNGQSYALSKGFIKMSDPVNTTANARTFSIILANGDVTYDGERDYKESPYLYSDNTTQHISFHLNSSAQNTGVVENTTFPIKDFSDPNFNSNNAFMDYSEVCTNVVVQNGNNTASDCLPYTEMKGQVTLKKLINGGYLIGYSYTDGENTVYGSFVGSLKNL